MGRLLGNLVSIHGVTVANQRSRECSTRMPAVLAWIDLETTGLDPERSVILEVAALITDDQLKGIEDEFHIVVHHPDSKLDNMVDVVQQMHSGSGLLSEVTASRASQEEARQQLLAFFRCHIPEARTVPLCGSSVAFDRMFLARHMPDVNDHMHYRSVDISSIKELVKRWRPTLYERIAAELENGAFPGMKHRARHDILTSLRELRLYRESGFLDIDLI